METSTSPQIPLWVRIETGHDSRLVDVHELKSQLEELKIPVQTSAPWHPSCSTGLEFVFELFANITLKDIILSGILYDGFKFAIKKVWNILKSFASKNQDADFDPNIIIRLDDVTIELNGSEHISIENQTEILENIASHIRHLSNQGINDIVKIDIPCLPCYLPEDIPSTYDGKVWRIKYGADDCAYYIPASKQIL